MVVFGSYEQLQFKDRRVHENPQPKESSGGFGLVFMDQRGSRYEDCACIACRAG